MSKPPTFLFSNRDSSSARQEMFCKRRGEICGGGLVANVLGAQICAKQARNFRRNRTRSLTDAKSAAPDHPAAEDTVQLIAIDSNQYQLSGSVGTVSKYCLAS